MKKISYLIIIPIVVCVVSFFLGVMYSNQQPLPKENVYWYDNSVKIFREIPKGYFDEPNRLVLWFSKKDIGKLELEKNYKDFLTRLDQMQAVIEYQREQKK